MQSTFSEDIVHGLSANPKRLPEKYLFDEAGVQIFRELASMPEYYQTPCESKIYQTHAEDMAELVTKPNLHIIEQGAGFVSPAFPLIKALLKRDKSLTYSPAGSSNEALKEAVKTWRKHLPGIEVEAIEGEWISVLEKLKLSETERPKLILIPGSQLGNYTCQEALACLKHLNHALRPGDTVIAGIDLKKAPSVILPASSDQGGVTARFNLNLLERINRELGGHFNTRQFKHYASYEPETGEVKSYLIAQKEQEVLIEKLNRSFHFSAWENVHTGITKKYNPEEFRQLATGAGFDWLDDYYDPDLYFLDVVLKKGL